MGTTNRATSDGRRGSSKRKTGDCPPKAHASHETPCHSIGRRGRTAENEQGMSRAAHKSAVPSTTNKEQFYSSKSISSHAHQMRKPPIRRTNRLAVISSRQGWAAGGHS